MPLQGIIDGPFSECAPGLRLLPLHKGWRRAEARSFCLPGPSCTLVSKIRLVGNRRSTSSWILCEHSSSCWGGGGDPQGCVKPEADQDEFLAPVPTEPTWESWTSGRHSSCCRVLVSLEHCGNTAFICVSPPGCCWGSNSEAAIAPFFPLLWRGL